MRRFSLNETRRAAELRSRGASYPQIAATLGRGTSTVYKAILTLKRHRREADGRYKRAVRLWRLADAIDERAPIGDDDAEQLAEAARAAAIEMLRTANAHLRAVGCKPKAKRDLALDAGKLAYGYGAPDPTSDLWGWLRDGDDAAQA